MAFVSKPEIIKLYAFRHTHLIMKTTQQHLTGEQWKKAEQLSDFVMFAQRSCILNLSSELTKDKVSFPQFFLMTYLEAEPFLTMSSIAKKMGHSTAASTGLVDKLEELGYVERGHAPNDRRKIIVRITAQGRELVAKMRSTIVKDIAGLMAQDPGASFMPFA